MIPDTQLALNRLNNEHQRLHTQLLEQSLYLLQQDQLQQSHLILRYQDIEYTMNQFLVASSTYIQGKQYPYLSTLLSYLIFPIYESAILNNQPLCKLSSYNDQLVKFTDLNYTQFFNQLNITKILDILQFKNTIACQKLEKDIKRTQLAKAWAKHAQRSIFWGEVKGNYTQQNQTSLNFLLFILENSLTQETNIVEVRLLNGKGARWTVMNGQIFFRGLVEEFIKEQGYDYKLITNITQ